MSYLEAVLGREQEPKPERLAQSRVPPWCSVTRGGSSFGGGWLGASVSPALAVHPREPLVLGHRAEGPPPRCRRCSRKQKGEG